ncbi:hypothetical protein [Shewanella surugensis]|uniref:FUSC family protein n=1 Tax=Shewanella surugensis TaxID=212020 RepID=A0ABT0L746_9GAMM|nr:hypothetical protein [Shewanella surugensis]MCL1123485.1 hypothetical protein [Shewanella surugensis]
MEQFRSLQRYTLKMRLFNALRATLIFLLIILFATFFQLPLTLFAIYPALFLMFYSKDESYTAGTSLVCGVLLSVVLMSICIHFLSQQPYLFFFFSLLISFAQAYWVAETMRNRWPHQITAIFSIIVTVTIAFTASSTSETTEGFATQWLVQFLIGLVILWFITQLVWPLPRSLDVLKVYSGLIEEYIFLLKQNVEAFIQKEKIERIPVAITLNTLHDIEVLIKTRKNHLSNETPHFQVLLIQLDALSHLMVNIRLIETVLIRLNDKEIDIDARRHVGFEIMSLVRRLDILMQCFLFNKIPQEAFILDNVESGAENEIQIPYKLSGIYVHIHAADKNITVLMDSLNKASDHARYLMTSKNDIKEYVKMDFKTLHVDSLKSAIKMMLAITLALLMHIVLPNVPASSYLVISIVVMLSQVNLGGIHLRLPLWIFGIVTGMSYSILGIFIISAQEHLILLIVWMAAGFLFGSYLAAGSAKTAYGGVQFCIGMTMTFGSQALPLSPPDETFERLIGALIGFLISFLVAHFIWPQQPRQQFRDSAANILIEAKGFLLTLIKFNYEGVDEIEKQFYQVSLSLRSNLIIINDYSHTFHKSAMIEEYMHQVNLSCSRLSLQVITVYDVFKNLESLQEKICYVQIFVEHEEVLFNLIEEASEMVSDVEKRVRENILDFQLKLSTFLSKIEGESSTSLIDVKGEYSQSKAYYAEFALLGVISELQTISNFILKTACYDQSTGLVDKSKSMNVEFKKDK